MMGFCEYGNKRLVPKTSGHLFDLLSKFKGVTSNVHTRFGNW